MIRLVGIGFPGFLEPGFSGDFRSSFGFCFGSFCGAPAVLPVPTLAGRLALSGERQLGFPRALQSLRAGVALQQLLRWCFLAVSDSRSSSPPSGVSSRSSFVCATPPARSSWVGASFLADVRFASTCSSLVPRSCSLQSTSVVGPDSSYGALPLSAFVMDQTAPTPCVTIVF